MSIISQEEADSFFNEMEEKFGREKVNHQALADNSGIPIIEAYVLYVSWIEKKINDEHKQ